MDINKSVNKLENDLFRAFLSKEGNVVFSPLSVILLLAMVSVGAEGKTRQEIAKVCGADHDHLIQAASEYLDSMSQDKMEIANALCVRSDMGHAIREDYLDLLEKVFKGEAFSSDNMKDDVNRWVSEKTDGMIPEIMDDSAENVLMSLIDAVCFKSGWDEPYMDEDIAEGTFHNADGSKSRVRMMNSTERVYVENDEAEGFIKNYRNNDYSFIALLPKKKGEKALKEAAASADFTALMSDTYCKPLNVYMPEFKASLSEDLTSILEALGMKEAFSNHADFSNMSTETIWIDRVMHKAHIEVDQAGTKASAVTFANTVGCAPMIIEKPKRIKLDRPFIYAVVDNKSSTPVFVGAVRCM